VTIVETGGLFRNERHFYIVVESLCVVCF